MQRGNDAYLRRDFAAAVRFYVTACERNDGFACANVGFMHERGLGVTVDYAIAKTFGERACRLGEGLGCNNVGAIYKRGLGIGADVTKAVALYRQACDLGSPIGCRNLASLYNEGHAEQTPGQAEKLLRGACNGGDGIACLRLGAMFEDADPEKAADAYAKGCYAKANVEACHSCAAFDPNCCHALGLLYQSGKAKPRTGPDAAVLLRRACDAGVSAACGPSAISLTKCSLSLTVAASAKTEVLLSVGSAPVAVPRLPVGARLEFIVLADGFLPRRAAIANNSEWLTGLDGSLTFELHVRLSPAKRGDRVDSWPAGEPGVVVGGSGKSGTVHVSTTPNGGEVWLVAGLGEAQLNSLRCDADVVLLAVGGTRSRSVVTQHEIAAIPASPEGGKAVTVRFAD